MLNQETKREWMAGWQIGQIVAERSSRSQVEGLLRSEARQGERSVADMGYVAALAASVGV